jgi:hypothetical protein
MDAHKDLGHTVARDQSSALHPETREQTIARVMDSAPAGAESGGSVDASSRRGLNHVLGRSLLRWTGFGALAGAVLGVALSFAPGPFDVTGPVQALVYALALALAGAVAALGTGPLFALEREDGRVSREVAANVARSPTVGPQGARPTEPDSRRCDESSSGDADDAARAATDGYPFGRNPATGRRPRA